MIVLASSAIDLSDPLTMLVVLACMALAPFLLTMITSFVKIVVVCGIIRSALGAQQIPPNQVITGLALILTVYIMWPVGASVYERFREFEATTPTSAPVPDRTGDADEEQGEDKPANATGESSSQRLEKFVSRVWIASRDPITEFLTRHTHPENLELFSEMQVELADSYKTETGEPVGLSVPEDVRSMIALVPAFVISELSEAFQIGFLIFVPFLVLDLVVSNLLLAMGMFMLSPTTVSLPLKLMLFVLVDGWTLIIAGLVRSYGS